MSHLDEATLVALRDGEIGESAIEAEHHLASCPACTSALRELRARQTSIADSLVDLDEPFDLVAARIAVHARMRGRGTPPRLAHWSFRRAASVAFLLVAAGAVYAMPGSPLRGWLAGGKAGSEVQTPPTVQTTPAVTSDTETGVHLDVAGGPLRIILNGVAAGTEIEVRWVSGTTASVMAPRGTRFTTSDGRIEAVTAPGTVRVELPRGALPGSLVVSGRTYLRNGDTGLDLPGPVFERGDGLIRFRVPAG